MKRYFDNRSRLLASAQKQFKKVAILVEESLGRSAAREFPSFVESPPRIAQIEVTNRCNLRCQMCPLADPDYEPSGGEAHLSLARFLTILEKLPALEAVSLQGLGEPLLNPELPDIIQAASDRGIHVTFFTNGMLLTEEKARALLESGLGHLVFSLDGATAETYERIRRGAKLDKLVSNIRGMVELKERMGASRTELSIMTVGMRENLAEIPDVVRIAGETGITAVTIKHLYEDAGLPGSSASLAGVDIQELKGRISEVASQFNVKVSLPHPSSLEFDAERTCRWPWSAVYVKVHGEVSPCCYGIHHEFCNLFESTPNEIWNNPGIRTFRAELRSGRPSPCKTCPDYGIVMETLPLNPSLDDKELAE